MLAENAESSVCSCGNCLKEAFAEIKGAPSRVKAFGGALPGASNPNDASEAAPPSPKLICRSGGRSANVGYFGNFQSIVPQGCPRWTEQMNLDLRAEFFNFPNHLSYFNVNSTLGPSTFGQVTGTTDPRTMEFVLRFKF